MKKMTKEERSTLELYIGKMGQGSKIRTFKEKDFKKELAPAHAIIERIENKGEKLVRMTYNV
ncbi:hypothetical protein ABD91_17300 [Lysinibacillus sphaericus]|uniref:hypothetical protein n=1 Tax=Lysinibacillus sphaericus TaxID=1421 RepID=UPI0018CF44D6|nr:hypothetical protein [Lysinibacillus sphaericus]MBG9692550.1 hypothetical protein [Lysinibacillus sphaericus]